MKSAVTYNGRCRQGLFLAIAFSSGVLIMYHYYQGLQKCLALNNYHFWLQHTPVIKPLADVLRYAIPALQLLLAALIIPKRTRQLTLTVIILLQLIFIIWVGYVFYATPYLFWPWRALWPQPTWGQKFMEALIIAWLALWNLSMERKNE